MKLSSCSLNLKAEKIEDFYIEFELVYFELVVETGASLDTGFLVVFRDAACSYCY